jgi:hypothetical protein
LDRPLLGIVDHELVKAADGKDAFHKLAAHLGQMVIGGRNEFARIGAVPVSSQRLAERRPQVVTVDEFARIQPPEFTNRLNSCESSYATARTENFPDTRRVAFSQGRLWRIVRLFQCP